MIRFPRFGSFFRFMILSSLLPVLACSRWTPEERRYVAELMDFRTKKDEFMKSPEGPLEERQLDAFKGLAYFGAAFDLIIEAEFQAFANVDTIWLPTSNQTADPFLRVGEIPLSYAEDSVRVVVYRSLQDNGLFLPFSDLTNGQSTYGGGRYLDVEALPENRVRLDFNFAYNPYCAYNSKWTCPLPPPQNRLPFAIKAGERDYPYRKVTPHE